MTDAFKRSDEILKNLNANQRRLIRRKQTGQVMFVVGMVMMLGSVGTLYQLCICKTPSSVSVIIHFRAHLDQLPPEERERVRNKNDMRGGGDGLSQEVLREIDALPSKPQ